MNKIITLLSLMTFIFLQVGNAQTPIAAEELEKPHATIEFEQDEFHFGTVKQGEKVKNVFVFTNTSDVPLVIANAKGSCGCTVPEWPREPIMPGESSQLLVVFNSKGKKGTQSKKVTITANTEVANTYLVIKGKVALEEEIALPKNRTVNENFFTIYPNPASERLNIALNDYVGENAMVEIFDNTGKLVSQRPIDKIEKKSYEFDLTNYESGIFTVTIVVGDKMRLAKQFIVM